MTSTEPDGGTTEPIHRSQQAIDEAKESAKNALTGLSPSEVVHEPVAGEEQETEQIPADTPPI